MLIKDFIDEIKNKFERLGENEDINKFTEKKFQIYCTEILLDNNLKAFMEYPFYNYIKNEDEKKVCDIVITEKENCNKVKTWIELKPIWAHPNSNYWYHSKFLDKSSPFRHDLEKLSKISPSENRWFIIFLFSGEKEVISEFSNPKPKIRLSANQIVGIVSKWIKKEPEIIKSFQSKTNYCHIIGWDVKEFQDIEFPLK